LQLGGARSLEKTRQTLGKSSAGYVRVLEGWSTRYGWAALAEQYDQTMAALAIQRHFEQYQRDLEEHRQRYQKAGQAIYALAIEMLSQLHQHMATLECTPNTLAIAAKALTTAGDLEAHALRLGGLLPQLTRSDSTE
jgi:phage-related tail protein